MTIYCEVQTVNKGGRPPGKHPKTIQNKIFYDTNFKKPGDGFCRSCGIEVPFYNLRKGYAKTCSPSCKTKARWASYSDKRRKEISEQFSKINKTRYAAMTREERRIKYRIKDENLAKKIYDASGERLVRLGAQGPGYTKFMRGQFKPKNPAKYKGDHTKIYYRSSWELRAMVNLDADKDVLEWSSEEVVVPYKSPLDGRFHRYFVDLWVRNKDGCYLIEIKPLHETVPPQPSKKRTKRYINEVARYAVNDAKWKAAKEYCRSKGWQFQLMTERELGIS